MEEIKRLPDEFTPIGTGIPNLKAKLLKREGDLCLYERNDFIWEVFFVQNIEAQELYGRKYPAREVYPSNECFGNTAWCFSGKENAEVCYESKLLLKAG